MKRLYELMKYKIRSRNDSFLQQLKVSLAVSFQQSIVICQSVIFIAERIYTGCEDNCQSGVRVWVAWNITTGVVI